MDFLSNLLGKYFLLSLIGQQAVDDNNYYCYSTDKAKAQQKHYSLQTKHDKYINKKENTMPDNCEPKQIWLVLRHGTRYPSEGTAKKFNILKGLQESVTTDGNLCEHDYNLIKNWKYNANSSHISCDLTKPQGWNDLKHLAMSYQTMFPTLFDPIYTPQAYTFGHSSAQRTRSSCAAFSEGLFGSGMMQWYSAIHFFTDNLLLRPWVECEEFDTVMDNLGKPTSQTSLFRNTNHFQDAIYNVSKRLGLQNLLTPQELHVMWDECRYQQSYNLDKPSPWCAAFTLDAAKVLEYADDLDFYYRLSYGDGFLSKKLPCVAIKDLLNNMANDQTSNKVTAFFSHAELLLMILTAFGAEHDEIPLMADNYLEQKNRKFYTSRLTPYAASFAAVKYECTAKSGKSHKRIQFLLNQKPLKMSWCKTGSVCKVSEIQQYFNNSTMRNCPNGICGKDFALKDLRSYTACKNCC